mgnify:CR=1 FL=1
MKKLMVFFVIFALMAVSVLAGSVSRSMPSRIQPGQTLTVTLSISGATADKSFTLEDVIPAGLKIKEWTVTGAKESKEAINIREKGNNFGWSFTPTSSSASVEYKIDLPNNEATYTFGKVVWFDPSGQGIEASSPTLTVANVRCGDGICEGNENSDNCVQDCPKPAPAQPAAPAAPEEKAIEKKPLSTTALAWIVVAIIVVVAAVGYFMWQKKKAE